MHAGSKMAAENGHAVRAAPPPYERGLGTGPHDRRRGNGLLKQRRLCMLRRADPVLPRTTNPPPSQPHSLWVAKQEAPKRECIGCLELISSGKHDHAPFMMPRTLHLELTSLRLLFSRTGLFQASAAGASCACQPGNNPAFYLHGGTQPLPISAVNTIYRCLAWSHAERWSPRLPLTRRGRRDSLHGLRPHPFHGEHCCS
jgi:hypothetical protein